MPTPGPGWRRRLPLWLLPVALWLVAALFLRGDLGKWNDDYFWLGQFNRSTGEVATYTLDRPLHFWRPAFRYLAAPVYTALFNHDRALHILSAITHAGACLALFLLLRRAGLAWPAASLGAMFLLVYPVGYEVPLWNISNVNALSTAAIIFAAYLYLAWLDARPRAGTPLTALAMAGLAFFAAALNEQPAAAAPALAVLGVGAVWARKPNVRSTPARPMPLAVARAAIPVLGAGVGLITYTLIHLRLHAMGDGHSTGALIPTADLPARIGALASDLFYHATLRDLKTDALHSGVLALHANPISAALAAAALPIGAIVWIRHAAAEPSHHAAQVSPGTPGTPNAPQSRWLIVLALFGVAWFIACWLPIVRIAYPIVPRLFYAPTVGLAITLAVGVSALASTFRAVAVRRAVYAVILAAYAAMAVMMVGFQRGYQARFRADEDQAQQLRRLIPAPPPNAIFVPIRVADHPASTRPGEITPFAQRFLAPLYSDWAGGWWLQRTYSRADIFSARALAPDTIAPLAAIAPTDADPTSASTARPRAPMLPPYPARREDHADWSTLIPFEITPEGRVRVFTTITAITPDGRRRHRPLPAAASALAVQGEQMELVVPWVEE